MNFAGGLEGEEKEVVLEVLLQVGFEMLYGNKESISSSELETIFKRLYPQCIFQGFLKGLTNCPIFSQDREGHYRFNHPTFKEYFATKWGIEELKKGNGIPNNFELFDDKKKPYFEVLCKEEDVKRFKDSLDTTKNLYTADIYPSIFKAWIVEKYKEINLDMPNLNLSNAYFYKANLERICLKGSIFTQAIIKDSNFARAIFGEIKTFERIRGKKVNFNGADFWATLWNDVLIEGLDMRGARLIEAQLLNVIIDGALMQGADLGGAVLTNCSMKRAMMQGVSIKGTIFNNVNLEGADLSGLNEHSEFPKSHKRNQIGTKLKNCILRGANLHNAYLRGADLTGAQLQGADLRGVDLREAILARANLQGCDLRGADLQGVNLKGTVLDRAINWRKANFNGAVIDRTTILPEGFNFKVERA